MKRITEIYDTFFYRYFSAAVDAAAVILMGILVGVVFLNIVTRYFFNLPLSWSEELAKILFVWSTFIGGVAASRRARHLRIDDVLKSMSPERKRLAHRFINVVASGALIALVVWGFEMARRVSGQVTDSLRITEAIYYLPIPVGSLMMLPYSLRNIVFGGERGGKA